MTIPHDTTKCECPGCQLARHNGPGIEGRHYRGTRYTARLVDVYKFGNGWFVSYQLVQDDSRIADKRVDCIIELWNRRCLATGAQS